jgi:flagellar assembly factor FliW
MNVKTQRFGELEVQPAQVFDMVEPPIGLEDRCFALIWDPRTEPVQWLQSTTTPSLCLPVADPLAIRQGYDVVIPASDCESLGLKRVSDALLLTVLVLAPDPAACRANLRAPLVLNIVNRKGKQIVLDDPDLPIQYFLFQEQPGRGNKEVADVGTDTQTR